MQTSAPKTLPAGDTALWRIALPAHPASAWTLTYELVNATSRITFDGVPWGPDPTQHLIEVPAATTATWQPGRYTWRARVSGSGQVLTVADGIMDVLPSFATAIDARTHAEKTLTAIEAYLERGDTHAAAQYEIAGRSLRRHSIPDLLVLRDRYRSEVQRERHAQSAGMGRVLVRFGGAR